MDPALTAMLTDTVQLAPFVGLDAYGSPHYGVPVSYRARIERHFQTMSTSTGPQFIEETQVYLNGDAVINDRMQLTLEDGAQPPIQGIKVVQDEFGAVDHYQVFL